MNEARSRMLSQNQSGIFGSAYSKSAPGLSTPIKRGSSTTLDFDRSKCSSINMSEIKRKSVRLECSTPDLKAAGCGRQGDKYNILKEVIPEFTQKGQTRLTSPTFKSSIFSGYLCQK